MRPHHTTRRPKNFKDETGNRYGRLLVIKPASAPEHVKEKQQAFWLCRCDCGNMPVVADSSLRAGNTTSCGCLQRERASTANSKHGMYRTPEYKIWRGMIHRCESPACPSYPNYGGRGVTVCRRWRDSFQDFITDMGRRPTPKHTLDRIDNNGHYSPENCRWTTREQQQNNRRVNRSLTYGGKTLTLAQWAKTIGIPAKRISFRLARGFPIEKVLSPDKLPNTGQFIKGQNKRY